MKEIPLGEMLEDRDRRLALRSQRPAIFVAEPVHHRRAAAAAEMAGPAAAALLLMLRAEFRPEGFLLFRIDPLCDIPQLRLRPPDMESAGIDLPVCGDAEHPLPRGTEEVASASGQHLQDFGGEPEVDRFSSGSKVFDIMVDQPFDILKVGIVLLSDERQAVAVGKADPLRLALPGTVLFEMADRLAERKSFSDDGTSDQMDPRLGPKVGKIPLHILITPLPVQIRSQRVVIRLIAVDREVDREMMPVHEIGDVLGEECSIGGDVVVGSRPGRLRFLFRGRYDPPDGGEIHQRLAAVEMVTICFESRETLKDLFNDLIRRLPLHPGDRLLLVVEEPLVDITVAAGEVAPLGDVHHEGGIGSGRAKRGEMRPLPWRKEEAVTDEESHPPDCFPAVGAGLHQTVDERLPLHAPRRRLENKPIERRGSKHG